MDKMIQQQRPEPNVQMTLRCQTCNVYVTDAYLDRVKKVLRYWCDSDHESLIEEFTINV